MVWGQRIKLQFTRAMITAALDNELDMVAYNTHPVFGYKVPVSCPNVPAEILQPRNTWTDKNSYDKTANNLAHLYVENFKKYADRVSEEILNAAPVAKA